MNNSWQLQEAKSKFSELIDHALSEGVQIVTRRGQKAVAVIAYTDYERLTREKRRLSQFLLDSPLADSELKIERDKELPRSIEIEA